MITVTVERSSIRTRFGVSWVYSWKASDNGHLMACNHPAPCGHPNRQMDTGKGWKLTEMRNMLRRKYGNEFTLIETWKS